MENSMTIITIKNVRGGMDGDIVKLNLEDVARGLGFTTVATSGNVCVRWPRVVKHLREIGETLLWCKNNRKKQFKPEMRKDYDELVGSDFKPEYISESVFYMLVNKANNDVARAFQLFVAYDVIPAIRKKGYYSAIPAEQLIKQLKAEMKKDKDLTPITVYEKLTDKKLVDKKQLLKDQEAERRKWQKERAEEIRRWRAFTMSFDKLYAEVEEQAEKYGVSKETLRKLSNDFGPQACKEVDGVLMFNQFAIKCALKVMFEIERGWRAG